MSVIAGRPRSQRFIVSKIAWSMLAWLIAIVFFFPVC